MAVKDNLCDKCCHEKCPEGCEYHCVGVSEFDSENEIVVSCEDFAPIDEVKDD